MKTYDEKCVEVQLRGSIELYELRQSLKLAIEQRDEARAGCGQAFPLLKKEFESIRVLPFITGDRFLAGEYMREAEQWREAMEACQKALQPVQAAVESAKLEVVR